MQKDSFTLVVFLCLFLLFAAFLCCTNIPLCQQGIFEKVFADVTFYSHISTLYWPTISVKPNSQRTIQESLLMLLGLQKKRAPLLFLSFGFVLPLKHLSSLTNVNTQNPHHPMMCLKLFFPQ